MPRRPFVQTTLIVMADRIRRFIMYIQLGQNNLTSPQTDSVISKMTTGRARTMPTYCVHILYNITIFG